MGFIFPLMLLCDIQTNIACTAFCLRDGNSIVLGKNLDWPVGDGLVVVNKRNVSKSAYVDSLEVPLKWISKYGSITLNQFGKEFPLGGMNEAGLAIEELSYPLAKYPDPDRRSSANEMQWIQYHLDIHSTVKEVVKSDSKLRISAQWFGLHYLVCDAYGDAVVVEFIDGNCLFYTGDSLPFEVLTNNGYAESIRYLTLHEGFGGNNPVRRGTESSQRFVMGASMVKDYQTNKSTPVVPYAFSILDSVRQDDTQWSIVYDLKDMMVHFKTRNVPQPWNIELGEFDFDCHVPSLVFDIMTPKADANRERFLSDLFVPYETELNRTLLHSVFLKLYELGEIDRIPDTKVIEALSKYPETLNCLQ